MSTLYLVQELTGNKWKPLLTTVRLTRAAGLKELGRLRADDSHAPWAKFRLATYRQGGR